MFLETVIQTEYSALYITEICIVVFSSPVSCLFLFLILCFKMFYVLKIQILAGYKGRFALGWCEIHYIKYFLGFTTNYSSPESLDHNKDNDTSVTASIETQLICLSNRNG